jgi:hypothetical protein
VGSSALAIYILQYVYFTIAFIICGNAVIIEHTPNFSKIIVINQRSGDFSENSISEVTAKTGITGFCVIG